MSEPHKTVTEDTSSEIDIWERKVNSLQTAHPICTGSYHCKGIKVCMTFLFDHPYEIQSGVFAVHVQRKTKLFDFLGTFGRDMVPSLPETDGLAHESDVRSCNSLDQASSYECV